MELGTAQAPGRHLGGIAHTARDHKTTVDRKTTGSDSHPI
ncbi:MAG: hypothetical protein JWQ39_2025 [Glaciihabitans sp.]|nr:hypothetical protein [Glaciihabitans sp.]